MTLLQDLRYGARLMRRNPGYAAVSVFTLAIGIGLTGMVFSILNGALLEGLPFEGSDRLMYVSHVDRARGIETLPVPLHDFEQWRDEQTAFEGIATFVTGTFNVRGTEGAERFEGAWVTANAFDVLRVRPVLGRGFLDGEDTPGAAPVAVISHRLWQDRYRGDQGALGQTLHINGEEATVVFALMGGVALFLAAVGLYGVLSFSVSRRRREMGVRMALGAERGDVIRLIMRQGGSQLAIGLAIGLAAAWGVSSLMETFIVQVDPRDPFTFGTTVLVLLATGLAASWVPAQRATRVDPIVAIRAE